MKDKEKTSSSQTQPNLKKLKYFRTKKVSKDGSVCYYWECKKEVAQKYDMIQSFSLGKDFKKAVETWSEVIKELEYKKDYYKKYKELPDEQKQEIIYGSLEYVAELYYRDSLFLDVVGKTQKEYMRIVSKIKTEILFEGQEQILQKALMKDITALVCEQIYRNFYNQGKVKTGQDYIKVLSNLFKTAIKHQITNHNPTGDFKKHSIKPREQIWDKGEFDLCCQLALEKGFIGLYASLFLAYYTGQRQTDIFQVKWSDLKEGFWIYRTSKTKAKVFVPITAELQLTLNKVPKVNEYIVNDQFDNKPYIDRQRLFSDRFEMVRKASNIRLDLCFRDLRRNAILKLDEAGCSISEITSITGHTRQTIIKMLEIYAPKTKQKAINAMKKLQQNKTS